MGICPQVHEALSKLATNLTFLTYLAGRLDLTRFSFFVRDNHLNSAPLRSVAFQLRVAGLCIITKEVLNPFPSFILHIYYNKKIEKNQILLLNAPRGNRTPISRSVAARSLHYPTGAKQDTSTALQTI